MRNIMIFVAIMIGLGTFMAQTGRQDDAGACFGRPVSQMAVAAEAPTDTGLRSLSVAHDGRGHFVTEGRIDGQRIAFMIDTGASVVA